MAGGMQPSGSRVGCMLVDLQAAPATAALFARICKPRSSDARLLKFLIGVRVRIKAPICQAACDLCCVLLGSHHFKYSTCFIHTYSPLDGNTRVRTMAKVRDTRLMITEVQGTFRSRRFDYIFPIQHSMKPRKSRNRDGMAGVQIYTYIHVCTCAQTMRQHNRVLRRTRAYCGTTKRKYFHICRTTGFDAPSCSVTGDPVWTLPRLLICTARSTLARYRGPGPRSPTIRACARYWGTRRQKLPQPASTAPSSDESAE